MKKILAGAVCLLMVLCALAPSALAAGTVCSMSVNDKLLDYSADTMPTIYDGQVYVPYTMFVSRSNGGVDLGVFHSWNKKANLMILYGRDKALLTFDIAAGNAYDVRDNVYNYKAIVRNGLVFLPAQKVCEYFDLQYSYVSHAYGTLVRVKQEGGYYLSDAFLISAAEGRLKEQKEAYEKDQQAIAPPTPGPTGPGQEEPSSVAVSFAFRSQTGEGLTRILDGLDRYGARGIFFFAPEDLAARDDEIRRLTATGHKVGLLLDGADTETCMEQAGEGNRLLKHIARTRTDFLLVEAEDPAEELEGRGWICWDGNVDGIPGEETTASRLASDLRRSLSRLSGEGRVTMDDSEVSAAALERLLSQLTADRYTFKTVTEADG